MEIVWYFVMIVGILVLYGVHKQVLRIDYITREHNIFEGASKRLITEMGMYPDQHDAAVAMLKRKLLFIQIPPMASTFAATLWGFVVYAAAWSELSTNLLLFTVLVAIGVQAALLAVAAIRAFRPFGDGSFLPSD